MPSQADLARHFGVSRERINQLCKAGMPTNSFRAAELWKEARGKKRKPTNERKFALEKEKKGKRGRPKNRKPIPKTGDTLFDALTSAISVQERAYEMVEDAMAEGSDDTISIRLAVHNKSLDARFAAERAYREELERRNILIPYTDAAELFRKGFDMILTRIRRMPNGLAPQCNPNTPLLAFTILERECNGIIAEAQKVYARPVEGELSPISTEPTDASETAST